MGLQPPDGQLSVVAAFLGSIFPDGDEDLVAAMGKVPGRYADLMREPLADGKGFAQAIVATSKGDDFTAFAEHFGQPRGASENLELATTGTRVVGLGLQVCAAIVLAHKALTLYQYGVTAAALASSGGAGGALLPVVRQAGRRCLDLTTYAAADAVRR
ncbi:hypothetical protein ABT294_46605 [Nonomuraea sp. NPDC000554]|uniref:hypothetical protein n=1 Tax=Nonomuraea sp. NPDC000554 TaxID=3154259 RepID=UPI0033180609